MSPRYSFVTRDEIEYAFSLIFAADGSMRFSRGEPDVSRDERAMRCTAKLPRALFRTPTLKATITVGDAANEFNVDVETVGDALRTALGVDIDMAVVPRDG